MATRVARGQQVSLGSSNSDARVQTSISGIDIQVDPTTRQVFALARIPGGAGFALGQPLRGNIAVSGTVSGVTIPYSALLDDGGKSFVFVVDKDTAHQVPVLPGNSAGDRIIVSFAGQAPKGERYAFQDFDRGPPLLTLTILFAVGVLALHRQNIRRLLAGTEPRFSRAAAR